MKKLISLTLAAIMLPLGLSAQSLVGTWKESVTGANDDMYMSLLVFNEDGTFYRDYCMAEPGPDGKPVTGTFHEEGIWKLTAGGKRIIMKVKPSSVEINAGEGVAKGVGKVVGALQKVEAFTTVYMPKVKYLSETELILLETGEDEYGDSAVRKVKYARQQ